MTEAVLVDAVRTPFGKRGGLLADTHPGRLLGQLYCALLQRNGVDPEQIDQILTGCVTAIGEQAFNIARMAWLDQGLPAGIGAATLDCQCGSSQHASHLISSLIKAGDIEIGIAGGVESMSRVVMGSNEALGPGDPRPDGFAVDLPNQFVAAERIATKWGIDRAALDAYGLRSQTLAARADPIAPEIVPLRLDHAPGAERFADEGLRASTAEGLAALRPIMRTGMHTAGSTSQISDGATAMLWMTPERAAALGLRPRARIVRHVLTGTDPALHIEGPIDATRDVLDLAAMSIDDIDIFEINEAFAGVVLAWQKATGADLDKVNVAGGAIALGHPMGATGGRLLMTAVRELERSGGRYGLIAMCCGSAVATGTIIERL